MRENLFRGKRKDNGEWIYGDLRHISDWLGGYNPHIVDNRNGRNNSVAGVEVDPETVGQYIGANDKNHKEIFEGDIVKSCDNFIYEIRWDNQRAMFYLRNDIIHASADFYHYFASDLEIIGNIHDNEMMEGGGSND